METPVFSALGLYTTDPNWVFALKLTFGAVVFLAVVIFMIVAVVGLPKLVSTWRQRHHLPTGERGSVSLSELGIVLIILSFAIGCVLGAKVAPALGLAAIVIGSYIGMGVLIFDVGRMRRESATPPV